MANLAKTSALDPVEIGPEVAALAKADLHLHSETLPRLDRILGPRNGRTPYDWRRWARWITADVPPGMPRLERFTRIPVSPQDRVPIRDPLEQTTPVRDLVSLEDEEWPGNFLAMVTDVLAEAARSGAVYAEVRFGRETAARPDLMTLFREAEAAVQAEFPGFISEALGTLVPQQDVELTERLVGACLRAADEGLAGVDVIPFPYDSEADWTQTYRWAERLASAGLGITVHAGEFSTANLKSALKVPGVRRIGHGIYAAADEQLLERLAGSGVALECCLTSNVILGAVQSYEDHPLKKLADAGIPVTLNTDDPIRFLTSIEREYALALRSGLTVEDLKRVTRNAVDFAFTTSERRERLKKLVS